LGLNLFWTALNARGLKYPAVSIHPLDSEIANVHCRSPSESEKSPQVKIIEREPVEMAVDRCSLEFSGEGLKRFESWNLEIGYLQLLRG
jgi:hypothetical protein